MTLVREYHFGQRIYDTGRWIKRYVVYVPDSNRTMTKLCYTYKLETANRICNTLNSILSYYINVERARLS